MRNWMLRTGIVLLGTVLLSLAGGLPALADPATVDLERRNDAVNGAVGSTVFVHAHLITNGPGNTATGYVTHEYTAPTGTELLGGKQPNSVDTVVPFGPECHWITPKVKI